MATTVYVKNIASKTEDKEIKDFFSFCGKINSIDVTSEGETKSATVNFEKETAARTALLLNHTKLGTNEISVTGGSSSDDDAAHDSSATDRSPDAGLTQEEKPRARVLAEILAHGYLVADTGLETAIQLDEKHGVTTKFINTVKQLDERTHATDKAKAADASYGLTARANSLLTGLTSYFEKAAQNPTGKKLVDFYTTSSKQVQDIHAEARRLADLKKAEHGGNAYAASGLDKVFGRFTGGAAKSNEEVPGAAPANAAAVESETKPTAPAGTGESKVIH
ncbi:hypothetical protein QBC40DRAFT_288591 [Triangularia verruculosa]|uniref:RRM domain-containing protein n=1 Tax=Triangularia verruculosa TaxID=2587418 RepID=A0AAN7ARF4_9PEZI|nr:hypothetical protein QBC40DRAFT_288591 [Triangularia verruculosa]